MSDGLSALLIFWSEVLLQVLNTCPPSFLSAEHLGHSHILLATFEKVRDCSADTVAGTTTLQI